MILRSTHSIITSPKDGIRTNKTTIKITVMTGTIYLDSEVLKIINHNSNKINKRDEQLTFILVRTDSHLKILYPLQDSNNKEISSDRISILIMHSNSNNKNK